MFIRGRKPLIAHPNPIISARIGRLETAARRAFVEAVDCSDDVALFVLDRRDMHDRPDVRAIRPLHAAFHAADWNARPQHFGHRCLCAGNEVAVEIELVRSAKQFVFIAKAGRPAPQFGRAGVEPEDAALCITGVDRDRELFEEIR
jgi:hypothetical protein